MPQFAKPGMPAPAVPHLLALAVFSLLLIAVCSQRGSRQPPGTLDPCFSQRCRSAPAPYTNIEVAGNRTRILSKTCGGGEAEWVQPQPGEPLLVVATIYSNEEDLMLAKLTELADVATHFVVVESNFSFTGAAKPLHFQEALCRRFGAFAAKLVHVVITEDQVQPDVEDAAWHREFQSRLAFQSAAARLGLRPKDVIFQADTDEIPTSIALETGSRLLQNGLSEDGVAVPIVDLRMQAYSFSLSHIVDGPDHNRILHNRAKMFTFAAKDTCTFQSIRSDYKTDSCPQAKILASIDSSGIHATYFMSPADVKLKLRSYAHTEFNKEDLNVTEMVLANNDPQGWWMKQNDAHHDINLMRFKPKTRALLIQHSKQLDGLQAAGWGT